MIKDAYDEMSAERFLVPAHRIAFQASKLEGKRRKALKAFLKGETERWGVNYKKYIKSRRWAELKRFIVMERGSTCERCGRACGVDLHHLTYVRLGNELPEDLKLYCRRCHFLMHPDKKAVHKGNPKGRGLKTRKKIA